MRFNILLLLLLSFSAYAQRNPGSRLLSMGSGGIALTDAWAIQQNPAGMAGIKKPLVSIAYEQSLLDADLSTKSAVFILPHKRNTFGFSFEKYGIEEYRQQQLGLSYSRSFSPSLMLAIGFRYYQLVVSQYGSARAFSVEAGLQFHVTDKFVVASHISNPNREGYNASETLSLPVKVSFGLCYEFSDRVLMIADVRKILDYPADIMTGLEYNLFNSFWLRGGISANPFKQYAGFGMVYKHLQIDLAVSSHANIGFTPQIAFGYEF